MSIFLHLSLEGRQTDSAQDLANLVSRGLNPFLALLDYSPNLKLNLSVNGALLETLDRKGTASIKSLMKEGRLEILLCPHVLPHSRWTKTAQLPELITLNRRCWESLGCSSFSGLYLGTSLASHELEEIGMSIDGLVVSGQSPPKDLSDSVFALAHASRLIFTRREIADLAQRSAEKRAFPIRNVSPPHLTLELRSDGIFPESLNPPQQRSELLDLTKDLRGEFASLSKLASTFEPVAEKGLPEFTIETSAPEVFSSAQELLAARVEELEDEMSHIPQAILQAGNEEKNLERFAIAKRELAFSKSAELWLNDAFERYYTRKVIYEHVLKAQVECDTILKTDIDPTIGWIEPREPLAGSMQAREMVIDSQLTRMYFSPEKAGAFVEFDYKPRKMNLCGAYHPNENPSSFVEGLLPLRLAALSPSTLIEVSRSIVPQLSTNADCIVTRRTKDLVGLRFIRPANTKEAHTAKFQWVKHFTAKAGIGAHLPNATTGFSLEYWLEGPEAPGPDMWAVSQMAFSLPSGTPAGSSVRLLTSVGGMSQNVVEISTPVLIRNEDIDGGLSGARLIDGLTNFVIDIRSAKALHAVGVIPLLYDVAPQKTSECGGFLVLFFVEARRIFLDDKANTIFVSMF